MLTARKFPFYKQFDEMDCGPTCLKMISEFHGKSFNRQKLRELCSINREGVSLGGLSEAAERIELQSLFVTVDLDCLVNDIPLPCIAHWRGRHFIVVYGVDKKGNIQVADPAFGLTQYTPEEFLKGWTNHPKPGPEQEGAILALEPTTEFERQGEEEEPPRRGLGLLLDYFKPHKSTVTQVVLAIVVVSAIQLVFPFAMQGIIDGGIKLSDPNLIWLILIGQLVLFASQTLIQLIRSFLVLHMTGRINIKLISNFLMKLMRLPVGYFDAKHTGDLIQRMDDHDRIQEFLSTPTLNLLFSVFVLLIFGSVLWYYSTTIFFIFLGFSLAYCAWIGLFMKKRAELEYKRFDQAAGNQSSRIQLITGMQEIKLNNSEVRRRWEWENVQIKLFKIALKSHSVEQWQTSGGLFIDQLKNIIITAVAAMAVINGTISLGMMLAIQYVIGQLNVPINNFLQFIQSAQDARISLDRLMEVHDQPAEDEEQGITDLPDHVALTLENLGFRYGSHYSPMVLEGINLAIPEGKVTAIVGPSGCGKTTLVKLCLKFYQPTEGHIQLSGLPLSSVHAGEWRRRCGAVMQDGFIFADTIARNITESKSYQPIDFERLDYAIKAANLTPLVDKLPSGVNTKIGQSGIPLSGGEKQRVLIARAIYKDPQVLFFDEATSALDANNERVIMENLEYFYKGRTVVVVAHRLSTVRNADQIIVMDKGRIVETGDHQTLSEKRGFYFELVKNQLELGT